MHPELYRHGLRGRPGHRGKLQADVDPYVESEERPKVALALTSAAAEVRQGNVRPSGRSVPSRLHLSVVSEISGCDKMASMTNKLKEIIERVQTWPEDRQEDAARVLSEMEKQDRSNLRLTDEQAAEVRRRLAEENPKTITLAEFNERLRQRYGA